MVNFHSFYSARYFVSSYSLGRPLNYLHTINLNIFSVGEVASLVFPNFSKFRSSIVYNRFSAGVSGPFFTVFCPFTKIVIPLSYLSGKTAYDFSWFLLFKRLPNFSNRIFIFAPSVKLIFLPFFTMKTAFFCSYFYKIVNCGSSDTVKDNGNSFSID